MIEQKELEAVSDAVAISVNDKLAALRAELAEARRENVETKHALELLQKTECAA